VPGTKIVMETDTLTGKARGLIPDQVISTIFQLS